MRFVLAILCWLSTVGSGLAQDGWFMPVRPEKLPEPPSVYRTPGEAEDLEKIKALFATMFPEVSVGYDDKSRCFVLKGPPAAVDEIREELRECSRDIDQVMTDLNFIELTSNGAKSLGLPEPTTVNATRTEYMNGVKISSKPEVTQVYVHTLPRCR